MVAPYLLKRWVILPGIGLDEIRFGSLQEDVRLLLGSPEDISEHTVGYDLSIAWYYWQLGVSAHFGGEDDFRLGTLQIERKDAELFGCQLIGLFEQEVRQILEQRNLGPTKYEVMEFTDFPTKCRLVYQDQGLTFWFKHSRLEAIQWGYLFGPNDEILWPRAYSGI